MLCSLPMLSRPWFVEPVGCPLAWLWLVWHEWRTSLCPQTDRPGKLHWPLVRPQWLHSGISGRSWNPGQSHGPGAGRGVSWWEVLCSSGISWFHEGQQFRACICEASSHPLFGRKQNNWIKYTFDKQIFPKIFTFVCQRLLLLFQKHFEIKWEVCFGQIIKFIDFRIIAVKSFKFIES